MRDPDGKKKGRGILAKEVKRRGAEGLRRPEKDGIAGGKKGFELI